MIPEGQRRYRTVDLAIQHQGCSAVTRAMTVLLEGSEAGVLDCLEARSADWKLEGLGVMARRSPPPA